jgi:hypothetical protein
MEKSKKHKLLLANDNIFVLESQSLFMREDFEVMVAENGLQAL